MIILLGRFELDLFNEELMLPKLFIDGKGSAFTPDSLMDKRRKME